MLDSIVRGRVEHLKNTCGLLVCCLFIVKVLVQHTTRTWDGSAHSPSARVYFSTRAIEVRARQGSLHFMANVDDARLDSFQLPIAGCKQHIFGRPRPNNRHNWYNYVIKDHKHYMFYFFFFFLFLIFKFRYC